MKKDAAKRNLNTKIKDLTPEIIAQLEKPLGTSSRPFPMWGSQRIEQDGREYLEQVLSVIADDANPMKVYSDRPYKEVIALAYCDMVVPSMLPLFFDGLERRKPESTNRTQMVIGNPGAGKSFMGAMQGRLRSKGSVEVFDCGGKNMNDLLFEMVLDFGAGDALPTAIDKRLKAGSLEPMSIGLLKKLPANVVTKDDAGNIASIDWNYFKGQAPEAEVTEAYKTLLEVREIEKLNAGGNALGMNSQHGALVRAFMEGREIVLDEYNKSREGSDNALQTVWQFLIGEIPSCTVENPLKNKDAASGPSTFTFRREDMQVGFFVSLTGNKTEDGVTTRSLNKSVYSRLSPQTLPDPDVADWQHRICQMMVGVPVSTLYTVFQKQADKDPAAFGEWLMSLRQAKAEIEGVPVPELQKTLLLNWQNVVRSSEKLAKFYDKWAAMTDAEKIIHGHNDLIDEVDEEYSKKEGIDFRKIKQHLEEAIPVRPRMQQSDAVVAVSFDGWDAAPVLPKKEEDENPSIAFGTRLTDFLDRMVYEKTAAVGKKKLYEKLRKAMTEFGLRDLHLQEAARSKQKSVEGDLNISTFSDGDLGKQAQIARKVFCNYIRQVEPEITATDDQIVTVNKLHMALEMINRKKTEETKELFVINRDHETLSADPLAGAKIEDLAVYTAQKREINLDLADLVHHDDFMASLALPTVSKKNISALWESNIRSLLGEGDSAAPANQNEAASNQDEALRMAENKSSYGLSTTTLRVRYGSGDDEHDVSVHVVRNSNSDKTLVVSEKAPSKLLAAFKEAGILHVDRSDVNAAGKVETALSDLTRGMPEFAREHLTEAFKYRNDADKKADLSSLLVDGRIEMQYAKYLVKAPKKAA